MNKKVYIVGRDHLIEKMFSKNGWDVVSDLESADIVQFTGGEDVTPEFYGEKNIASSCNSERDLKESVIYISCLTNNVPMTGICRGGQFLNVMAGGRMYQDVTKHAIAGTHPVTDLIAERVLECTSTHHQEMIPAQNAVVLATASLGGTKLYLDENGNQDRKNFDPDIEVLFYEKGPNDTPILCFQPHPEYGCEECREYYFDLIEKYLLK